MTNIVWSLCTELYFKSYELFQPSITLQCQFQIVWYSSYRMCVATSQDTPHLQSRQHHIAVVTVLVFLVAVLSVLNERIFIGN